MHLIEFAICTHDGRATKIRTSAYVHYHTPLETMARASDCLGVDCPDGRKKVA